MEQLLDSAVAPAHGLRNGVSRRTLVAGIAWSVPAVVIVGAAPAYAASGETPPPTYLTVTQGVRGGSGTLLSGQAGYTGWTKGTGAKGNATAVYVGDTNVAGFASGADPASNGGATVTATYTFPATRNAVYSISLDVMANFGSPSNKAQRQLLEVSVAQASAATAYPVRVTPIHAGITDYLSNNTDGYWDSHDYELQAASATAKTNYSGTFSSGPNTGTATITYTFTMPALTGSLSVWDDIWASAPLVYKTSG